MKHLGVLYELTTVSPPLDEGVIVELWDMSAHGGPLGEAKITSTVVTLVQQEPMPGAVYEWWAAAIVTASRRLADAAYRDGSEGGP